jgi:hypothetical protein
LIPSPIGKVLSIFRKNRVRALLMGGQACVLYGAAEFSRDIDLAVLANARNLDHLRRALAELNAEPVFVPGLNAEVLLRGHACHFRVHVPEAEGLRIDIMSVLHGCAPFEELWERRRRVILPEVGLINVLALADLVQAKKTQRDKDWPMVRRLVEADYHARPARPSRAQIEFWLREARTPSLLVGLSQQYLAAARRVARQRVAVRLALNEEGIDRLEAALRREEDAARETDRVYWQPLRAELAHWRRVGRENARRHERRESNS